MTPDDPRHGSNAGHVAGCRDTCCWAAKLRYDKRRRWDALQGRARKVPSTGAVRRIQALRALGWSVPRLAQMCGLDYRQIYNLARYPTCYRNTHDQIAELYERLAMRFPPEATTAEKHAATKTRRTAQRNGWAPPLAWDDIDHDPAPQDTGSQRTSWPSAELAAEWDHLRRLNVPIEEAAPRLGVTVGAIEKAIERTRKDAA